jgi:succinate dehydrogenase/fumarate reductase flavoprotein subunit
LKKRLEREIVNCDLLVVGAGLAGCMAAIKGADQGLDTIVVEKANAYRSGAASTGVDHIWAHFPEIQGLIGYTAEDLIEDHMDKVGGMIHEDLLRTITLNALDRIHDLEKMGVKVRYEDSKLPGGYILVRQIHSVVNTLNFDGRDMKIKMTKEMKKRGAKIINRVMITGLLKKDGIVIGAIGVGTRNKKLYIFKAKAVIMSTARISGGRMFNEPGPGAGTAFNVRWPGSETGDGKIAAFNAGAELINLEFSHHRVNFKNFVRGGGLPYNSYSPAGQGINASGDVIMPQEKDIFENSDNGIYNAPKLKLIDELNQGRGPIYCDLTEGTEEEIKFSEWSLTHEGGGYALLHLMKDAGIDFRTHKLEMGPGEIELGNFGAGGIYVDDKCHSTVPGLFAAGDEMGGVPLGCAPGALATGWYAAEQAETYIKDNNTAGDFEEETVEQLEALCLSFLEKEDGYRWQDSQIALNRIMSYYATNLKSETMLLRGLENLDYLQNHNDIQATNAHELMRCLEMHNLIENAKLIMQGNLERKESRKIKSAPIQTRLDYPEQNDAEWSCALSQRLTEEGNLIFAKRPFRRG